MRRRDFIAAAGCAVMLPSVARAQQRTTTPMIGYLGSTAADEPREEAFRAGLREQGYTAGDNVSIEYLFAAGNYDRLPPLVADFQRRNASVIFASGNQAALAAKAAGLATPVVFALGDDPVRLGLVSSMNAPGANTTGVTFYAVALIAKRLGLLHEMVERGKSIAVLSNPRSPSHKEQIEEARTAAQRLGRQVEFTDAATPAELDAALTAIAARQPGGLVYATDPFFNQERRKLIGFAEAQRIAVLFSGREYTTDGAAVSYGANILDAFRQSGSYVGRVLRGTKPAELPVVQPTRYELIVNLASAKRLGLNLPPVLLALADEVIE